MVYEPRPKAFFIYYHSTSENPVKALTVDNLSVNTNKKLTNSQPKKSNLKELKRQLFHASCGIIVLIALNFFQQNIIAIFLFALTIIGLFLSIISRKKDIPFFSKMLDIFDRKADEKNFPGKGAIALTFGLFLSLYLFPLQIAKTCIIILALGDAGSAIIGKYFGKIKPIKNNKRTIEGSLGGFVLAFLGATIYVSAIPAIIASASAMISEYLETKWLDDNILIPVISGIVLYLFM